MLRRRAELGYERVAPILGDAQRVQRPREPPTGARHQAAQALDPALKPALEALFRPHVVYRASPTSVEKASSSSSGTRLGTTRFMR